MFYIRRKVNTGKNLSSLLQKIEEKHAREGTV